MNIEIKKMGINGEGIGYIDNKPVFVDGAFPSEIVDINIIEKNDSYSKGEIFKLVKKSEERIIGKCNQERCKACSLINMDGKAQAKYKRQLVEQALYKYARIPSRMIEETIPNYRLIGYRNQFKMPLEIVDGKMCTGMFLPNSNVFLPLEACVAHEVELEEVRIKINEIMNKYELVTYDKKERRGLRSLVVRHFEGKFQVTIVSGKDYLPSEMIEDIFKIEGVINVAQSINTRDGVEVIGKELKVLKGDKYLQFKINNILLNVSNRSFFQLNTYQAARIYKLVYTLLSDRKYKLIIEAYSGVGGLGLTCKDLASEIIGIENINSAVVSANENAVLNNAPHVKFIFGDAGEEIIKLTSKGKRPDALIVDPPRLGLSPDFIKCLLSVLPSRIVYVSCNPSTLGKDLNQLQTKYKIKRIIPVDMFSNTAHVETVVLLEAK